MKVLNISQKEKTQAAAKTQKSLSTSDFKTSKSCKSEQNSFYLPCKGLNTKSNCSFVHPKKSGNIVLSPKFKRLELEAI